MSSYCVIGPEIGCTDHVTPCIYGGPDGINIKDRAGRTVLHRAVARGRSHVVEKLLCSGADPNIADNEGFTALHLAVINCRIDLVRLLLRFDADCNGFADFFSPLALAVKILSETSAEFAPVSMTYSSSVIKTPSTSSKNENEDFSSPVVVVNNVNEYKDFAQDYFAKYISRGLLHISFTLLHNGSEICTEVRAHKRCCQILEKAVITVTQPQKNGCIYTDLLTLSVCIERLCKNGCTLPSNFSTTVSKSRDYQDNEPRKRLVKLFCLILKGQAILELAKMVCQRHDEEMIDCMIATGHRDEIETALKERATCKVLLDTVRKPSSLSDICRIKIRQNLSLKHHGCSDVNIGKLPLPKSLKKHLSFNDWCDPYERTSSQTGLKHL